MIESKNLKYNYTASMNKINFSIEKFNRQQKYYLEMNLHNLTQEYNRLRNKIQVKEKEYSKLNSYINSMNVYKITGSKQEREAQLYELQSKITSLNGRLRKSRLYEKKLQKIIEICEINKIQNENWMRNLNFYIKNLLKLKEMEKTKISDIKKKNEKIQKMINQIIKIYNDKIMFNKQYT